MLALTACKRDRCDVPIGETGAIYLPDFPDIYNNVGGTVVLNKGHRGILVRCSGFGEGEMLNFEFCTIKVQQWCFYW